jgi:hypothetical protein
MLTANTGQLGARCAYPLVLADAPTLAVKAIVSQTVVEALLEIAVQFWATPGANRRAGREDGDPLP